MRAMLIWNIHTFSIVFSSMMSIVIRSLLYAEMSLRLEVIVKCTVAVFL